MQGKLELAEERFQCPISVFSHDFGDKNSHSID